MALARTDIGIFDSGNGGGGGFGTGPFSSGSFTPPSNSLLVVGVYANNGHVANLSLTGGGWTYTPQVSVDSPNLFNDMSIWTAPVGVAANMTVTVDCGADSVFQYILSISAYTGYLSGTPVGGIGTFSSNNPVSTTLTVTLNAAPTVDDEIWAFATSDGSSDVSPGAGYTEVNHNALEDYACAEIRTGTTTTTVTWGIATGIEVGAAALVVKADTTAVTPTTAGYFIEDTTLQRKPQTQRMLAADPQFATPFQPANNNPNVGQPTTAGVIKTRMIPC